MDTPKKNDPKVTQTVGNTTTPGPAPPTSDNTVPVVDLVTSGDALGDPGATGGDLKNSDHLEPKELPTPTVKPTLKRDRRKTNPPTKYDSYVIGTKLPQRDLIEKEADKSKKIRNRALKQSGKTPH